MFRIRRIDWGSRFEALERIVSNPTRALKQIGAIMASRAKQGMVDQGRTVRWRPRAVPNIPGILRDFHLGRSKPVNRRFEDRPAVFDEGTLAKSINHEVVSDRRVEIGVHGPAQKYVDVQHFGGESPTEPVTPEFQEWLKKWLRTGDGKPWAGSLRWLTNPKVSGPIEWNVTARPIFVLAPEDLTDIAEMTGVHVVGELHGGP